MLYSLVHSGTSNLVCDTTTAGSRGPNMLRRLRVEILCCGQRLHQIYASCWLYVVAATCCLLKSGPGWEDGVLATNQTC